MIDIDWKPTSRKLRQFAVASLVGFPLIALLLGKLLPLVSVPVPDNLIWIGAITGAVICILGLTIPKSIVPIYVALMALALPIGLTVSFLLIPLIYYGVFTPIALGLRALGKDPMNRALGRSDTYWMKRKPTPAAASYYKQY